MPAEIAFEDLRSIIEFIYRGEIDVPEGSLQVNKYLKLYTCLFLIVLQLTYT